MTVNASDNRITGRVRKYHSNFYYVEADGVDYECMLRGLIKKEGTEVLVGDFVILDTVDPANRTARIYDVQPRHNVLLRPKMANVDQVLVLYSLREPEFDPSQMDRYLTHIELAGLTPIICISKADLARDPGELEAIRSLYQDRLGFEVLFTSTRKPESLQAVLGAIQNKITVLAGPSGAGKSSLLNTLNPDLQLRVGEVSGKIERGQHTTRHVELLQLQTLDPNTLIADTPGFSNLKFNTVLPRQIEQIFRDFAPYREHCAFSDCLHVVEVSTEGGTTRINRDKDAKGKPVGSGDPSQFGTDTQAKSNAEAESKLLEAGQGYQGCAVMAAMDQLAPSRYASYTTMLAEARTFKEEAQASSQKQEYGYKQVSKKGQESVKILRLKERNRDVSRRTQKQQVRHWDASPEEPDDETTEENGTALEELDDFLVDEPSDPV